MKHINLLREQFYDFLSKKYESPTDRLGRVNKITADFIHASKRHALYEISYNRHVIMVCPVTLPFIKNLTTSIYNFITIHTVLSPIPVGSISICT